VGAKEEPRYVHFHSMVALRGDIAHPTMYRPMVSNTEMLKTMKGLHAVNLEMEFLSQGTRIVSPTGMSCRTTIQVEMDHAGDTCMNIKGGGRTDNLPHSRD
jgi:hypothetical protein